MRWRTERRRPIDLPYDVTGWTLPLQMGVNVDAVTDPLGADQRALLTKIDKVELPDAWVDGAGTVFAVSHRTNASFEVVNAALAAAPACHWRRSR